MKDHTWGCASNNDLPCDCGYVAWVAPLTDEELRKINTDPPEAERLVDGYRRQRDLIRKLVLEAGCPWKTSAGGVDRCARCGGTALPDIPGEKQRYKHAQDCIWLELEREVKGA